MFIVISCRALYERHADFISCLKNNLHVIPVRIMAISNINRSPFYFLDVTRKLMKKLQK